MNLYDIISYTGYLILLLNNLFFLKSIQNSSRTFQIFFCYLLFSLIIQTTTEYLFIIKVNNLFLSHYYFIGQFILLSLFFKQVLKRILLKKIVSIILVVVLITIGFYYINYPSKYHQFNVFEIVITSLPLLIYSFFFFLEKLENPNRKYIYVISGFFLYILCSTLLFTVGNVKAEIKKLIWYSNAILYIIYQVLIFVEWYKNFKNTPHKT